MNSSVTLGSLRVRRTQKAVKLKSLEWPHLKQKQTAEAMKADLQTKSPKLLMKTIQPLTERRVAPDRAMQTVYG